MLLDAAVLVGFALALLAIGRWAAGGVRTTLDFHLAGRRLGRLPAALSLAATEFNGSGLVGGAGLAYSVGVAGAFWNLSAVPAWLVLGWTVAVAFRRRALYTVPELLEERYGPATRRLASASQLASGSLFTTVQIVVSAYALSAALGLEHATAAVLVTLVFVTFTYLGGLPAVVWTDVACYFVLMLAVVAAFPIALAEVGGLAGLRRALPAERFDFGQLGVSEPLAWVALCFYSYATDQAYLQRAFAAKDAAVARFAYVFTGLNYLVFAAAVALLGMAAAATLPGLARPDEALPALVQRVLPPGARSLVLAGLLAATVSTASAYLSAGASLFAKDLFEPLAGGAVGERRLLRVSRAATVGISAIALALAISTPRVVDTVVLSVLVSHAAVFFPVLAALYWPGVARVAGFWSIFAGAAAGLVSHFALYRRAGPLAGVHPLFVGPAAALAVLLALTWASGSLARLRAWREEDAR